MATTLCARRCAESRWSVAMLCTRTLTASVHPTSGRHSQTWSEEAGETVQGAWKKLRGNGRGFWPAILGGSWPSWGTHGSAKAAAEREKSIPGKISPEWKPPNRTVVFWMSWTADRPDRKRLSPRTEVNSHPKLQVSSDSSRTLVLKHYSYSEEGLN